MYHAAMTIGARKKKANRDIGSREVIYHAKDREQAADEEYQERSR
jgi:hypothetical protein